MVLSSVSCLIEGEGNLLLLYPPLRVGHYHVDLVRDRLVRLYLEFHVDAAAQIQAEVDPLVREHRVVPGKQGAFVLRILALFSEAEQRRQYEIGGDCGEEYEQHELVLP